MYFEQVNSATPERVLMAVTNSYSTAAFNDGDWCCWDIVTDKNGYTVTLGGGANRSAVAGCFVQYTAPGQVGLIQIRGYKDNAKVKGGSGSITAKLTAGSPLVMNTGNLALGNRARTVTALKSKQGQRPWGVFIEPLNTAGKALSATTSRGKVLIYCM